MKYRRLGRTELSVSEIGLGAEWFERMELDDCRAVVDECAAQGVNILDCWMAEPTVRSKIGDCLKGSRERWLIQGHIGSTHQNGQYVRSRELPVVKEHFEDLMRRVHTDYIDLGMIHYVDSPAEWDEIVSGPFIEYVRELKARGVIRCVGLSTHNPLVGMKAARSGEIDMMMFSINPAFDLMPPTEDVNDYFAEKYDASLLGVAPERTELYQLCAELELGVTVMKPFAGGRLFKAEASPFGVALTPVQCLHYALTRPAVASVMAGFSTPAEVRAAVAYESATDDEKDYVPILSSAPRRAFDGKCMYCNHCKPCPVDIDIAMVNKFLDLATMQPAVPESVREHYFSLTHTASDCLACGGCETRCPFGVKVVERMSRARKVFGEAK